MPYTRSWDDTAPPGSRSANEIDDAIRELRVDIHERMDDIVQDWEADPIVPIGGAGGGGAGGKHFDYIDTNSPTAKVTAAIDILYWMSIRFNGNTDSLGIITIDFDELPGAGWAVSDIIGGGTVLPLIIHWLRGVRLTDGLPLHGNIAFWDNTNNLIKLKILHASGAVVASTAVSIYLLLPMKIVK